MSVVGMIREDRNNLRIYRWKIFEPWRDSFLAVMTTRIGGVSQGPYNSLNLGFALDDTQENVEENRRRLSETLSIEGFSWSVARQIHGCRISRTDPGDVAPHTDTDALEIQSPGVVASVTLADCHPVIIYDPHRHAVVICHAGWRGTVANIAGKAVNRLLSEGSRIENLVAATGPGIGPCCYQVGPEVMDAFLQRVDEPRNFFHVNDNRTIHLDIEAANIAQLRHAGIAEERIGSAGFCTACRPAEFYSYRKERGHTGRQSALVALF